LSQVGRVEALSEPPVYFFEHAAGLFPLALVGTQAAQTHRRSQLEGSDLLTVRDRQRLAKAGFRLLPVRNGLSKPQLPRKPIQLGLPPPLSVLVHERQGLAERAEPRLDATGLPARVREPGEEVRQNEPRSSVPVGEEASAHLVDAFAELPLLRKGP